ncbi:MAG TPA: hypothetical protein P5280_02445 [Cyclobacteriaceae bacterium]|nr:hypothetical protein [Cyclobacteriaceae bacterium]
MKTALRSSIALALILVITQGTVSCQVAPEQLIKKLDDADKQYQYATLFVRVKGEKILYSKNSPGRSPLLTISDYEPIYLFRRLGLPTVPGINDTTANYNNLAEVISRIADDGWVIKTMTSTVLNDEDRFWMVLEKHVENDQ